MILRASDLESVLTGNKTTTNETRTAKPMELDLSPADFGTKEVGYTGKRGRRVGEKSGWPQAVHR